MSDRGSLVIDRGFVFYEGRSIDLREAGRILAMIEIALSKPDCMVTLWETAEDWYRKPLRGAETEERERMINNSRQALYLARRKLEAAFGGEWFRVVEASERPPRYLLHDFQARSSKCETHTSA